MDENDAFHAGVVFGILILGFAAICLLGGWKLALGLLTILFFALVCLGFVIGCGLVSVVAWSLVFDQQK